MMLDWQCRLLERYRGELAEMGLEVVPSTDFEALGHRAPDESERQMGTHAAFFYSRKHV